MGRWTPQTRLIRGRARFDNIRLGRLKGNYVKVGATRRGGRYIRPHSRWIYKRAR